MTTVITFGIRVLHTKCTIHKKYSTENGIFLYHEVEENEGEMKMVCWIISSFPKIIAGKAG